ncbi:MAG: putative ABC transporter permease subunit [Gemmatimonadales bacterium]
MTRQPSLLAVTSPKWRSVWARLRRRRGDAIAGRTVLLTVAALLFFAAAFLISYRITAYFKSVPEIGPLLASKMLGMALLAFAAILLLSNLIGSLSTFFLARDLDMLVAAPVEWGRFYIAKLGETVIHSSWMVALLAAPLLAAYGIAWHAGPLFPVVVIGALVPLLIIPGVVGTAITLMLVNLFPARRTRDVLGLITIVTAAAVVMFIRLAGPERLARPDGFQNLVDFIAVLRAPTHPLLPSEWARAMLMNWLNRVGDPLPIALLWTTAGAFVVMGAALHKRWYTRGFARAQEGANRFARGARWDGVARRLLAGVAPMRREFFLKDLRIFFRDSTQWSQLVLLAVLIPVMLLNVQMLPLFSGERLPVILVTIILFVTQGLAGFVIAGAAERLVFPAVSLEGRQLWLLRSSPLDARAMLRGKYLVGVVPLLVLALGLTITTNHLLHASHFMMVVSVATVLGYTLAVGGLALGMGALFPQFDTENAAQIATSFGGLVFMLLAVALLGLVISLESVAVTEDIRYRQIDAPTAVSLDAWIAFGAAAVFCLLAGVIPMRLASRRLESLEV